MPIKHADFIIKGMHRDLSESVFNPEFAYENQNIRITSEPNSDSSHTGDMYAFTNEKGNKYTYINNLIKDNGNIKGVPIGQCLLNNQWVIFTTQRPAIQQDNSNNETIDDTITQVKDFEVEETTSTNNNVEVKINDNVDRIYRLYFVNDDLYGEKLYEGHLNFNYEYPIETIGYYENEEIQKVYWTDGINPLRFINIVEKDEKKKKWNDVSFEFIPIIQNILGVKISVTPIKSMGSFPAGVIQYCFTYSRLFGPESNIVYTTELYEIRNTDRGLSPEELCNIVFKLDIKNIDTNFEYIHIYSIIRTSLDNVPITKLVVKLPITSKKMSFIDNNLNGQAIEPQSLFYKGGEQISAYTMDFKDATLFLGNYKLLRNYIDDSIKERLLTYSTGLTKNRMLVNDYSKSNFKFTLGNNVYEKLYPNSTTVKYDHDLMSHFCIQKEKDYYYKNSYFRFSNIYRMGLQFQHETGKWSEVVWIGDYECQTAPDWLNENGIVKPLGTLILDNTLNTIIQSLIDSGYRRVRPVCIYPNLYERSVITQGLLCNTVQQELDSTYYYPDWFVRPYGSRTAPYVKQSLISGFNHNSNDTDFWEPNKYTDCTMHSSVVNTLNDDRIRIIHEIEGVTPMDQNSVQYAINGVHYHEKTNDTNRNENIDLLGTCYAHLEPYRKWDEIPSSHPTLYSSSTLFYKSYQVLSYYSPDIEFDDSYKTLKLSECYLQSAGQCQLDDSTAYTSIEVSSVPKLGWYKIIKQDKGGDKGVIYNSRKPRGAKYKGDNGKLNMIKGCHYIGGWNYESYVQNAPVFKDKDVGAVWTTFLREPPSKWDDIKPDSNFSASASPIDSDGKGWSKSDVGWYCFLPYYGGLWYYPTYVWMSGGSITGDHSAEPESVLKTNRILHRFSTSFTHVYNDKNMYLVKDVKVYDTNTATIKVKDDVYYKGEVNAIVLPYPDATSSIPLYAVPNGENAKYFDGSQELKDTGNPNTYQYSHKGNMTCLNPIHFLDAMTGMTSGEGVSSGAEDALRRTEKDCSVSIKYRTVPHYVLKPENQNAYGELLSLNAKQGPVIANLLKNVDTNTIFGGYDKEEMSYNQFLPCGETVDICEKYIDNQVEKYRPLNNIILVWSVGDTYCISGQLNKNGSTTSRYELLKTYPMSFSDENCITEIIDLPVESYYNYFCRYDVNKGKANFGTLPANWNLNNPIYNQKDNFFTYQTLNTKTQGISNFPNSFTWTLTKWSGDEIDKWTQITLANTMDVNGSKQRITKILNFHNDLLCFQPNQVSNILYNEREQLSTQSGVPVELSNSGKVSGIRPLTVIYGCNNKWSIVCSEKGLYWIDDVNKHILQFAGQGIISLSDQMGFHSWINDKAELEVWNPLDFKSFISYFDPYNENVMFIYKDNVLSFNEQLNCFDTFLSYGYTPYYVAFNNTAFMLNDTDSFSKGDYKVWEMFKGDYNYFFVNDKCTYDINGNLIEKGIFGDKGITTWGYQPYWTILLVNPDMTYDKVFNNVDMRTDMWNKNKELLEETFSHIEVWNEFQWNKSTLIRQLDIPKVHYPDQHSILKKKFRVWYVNIPRDTKQANPRLRYYNRDRMRNTWIYLKLSKELISNDPLITYPYISNNKHIIHHIGVSYFV